MRLVTILAMMANTHNYARLEEHLDWSHKQRRILTANGNADRFYCAERGFPFSPFELPHHYLQQGLTQDVFGQWKQERSNQRLFRVESCPIIGAWKRPLFYGGWEHSTDRDEHVFNVQTSTLFVDLRIPCRRNELLLKGRTSRSKTVQSLADLDAMELRWYARQHIFAGYSRVAKDDILSKQTTAMNMCCTRHHCIDWNFVGVPRSRPNKWWIEMPSNPQTTNHTWKEWAYATDDNHQHYYCEQWEQLPDYNSDNKLPILALRKRNGRDGVIVVVGDHFNYCIDRDVSVALTKDILNRGLTSLVDVADAAIAMNELDTARAWLSMQGGHGRVSLGWKLDHCIEPWREGQALWSAHTDVAVRGDSIESCTVLWNGDAWDVFECSMTSVVELKDLLGCDRQASRL